MEELFYTIDKKQSGLDNALVIKIQIGVKNGLAYQAINSNKILTQEVLLRAAGSRDSAILPFLIKEELEFIRKKFLYPDKTTSFQWVHIAYGNTAQALKLFATSGRLHLNDKQITIDLFGKTEFFYQVDTTITPPSIKGVLKTISQEFEVSACEFICKGPPHWFIRGITLKFITTEISWKDFKSAFEQEIRSPQDLFEEAREDSEAPRVIINAANYEFQEREPLPILMLKDRLGAFADLWMDYGDGSLVPLQEHSKTILNKEGIVLCKRLPNVEHGWEKDLLETDFIKKTVDSSHYYCPVNKVFKSIAFLIEIGWQIRDSKNNLVLMQGEAELFTETDAKAISVKGKIHYGTFEADLANIIGAFNRRERFAQITSGHVALLPNSWETIGLDALVEEGEIVGDSIKINKSRIGSLASLFETQPGLRVDASLKQIKEKLECFDGISTALPGSSFKGTLRPYQQEGLNWLSFLFEFGFHGLLADDMGLGKTVQVLAFISRLELFSPVLIGMPTSLIFNWKKEIERFLPGIHYLVHHGDNRPTTTEALDKPHIILTTYTTLRLDFALLSQLTFGYLILDEAQAIKNAHTQTAQSVRFLNSQFRLSITGTPIENNLLELWSHFNFLIPDLFSSEESFKADILAGASDPRFLKRIKKTIRPFILRRRKEEVAKELPEKIEQTVWIEMSANQRATYEEFLSGVRRNLIKKINIEGVAKHRMEILEAIMRLRQICCHPILVTAQENKPTNESAKLEALITDLEVAIAEGRKVLIYSQFTSMLSLISKRLKENNWNFVYLDGSTQNREKVVNEFQNNPDIPLFLISLKAGGIGLNLTAADYVFLYDPWWNNAVENQAIDRAHRIGRQETVIAKRYIVLESIEEKMMKLKASKASLAAELLDEGLVSANLSADDLLFLLS
ncbi:MAG: DEAD/DEAH box helicase [Parachlamydiaceae bacterium]|nr:DEAD/DEAH box helicase [Parachlamydiaceae bacterium]